MVTSCVRIRALHTEGFRITAIFVVIFALSAAVLGATTLITVDEELRNQIVQYANSDIAAIRDGYRTQGPREAAEIVGQRLALPGSSDFLILQHQRTKLSGNLAPMVPQLGTFTLPYPGGRKGHEILGVGSFITPDLYVFSGSDLYNARQARQRILQTLIWVFMGAFLLALAGGFAVSRGFLHRTDEIVRTCRAIMAGNLASRVPLRGADDELDRLSDTINTMLDRIAALMDNLRQITNDIAHDLRTPVTHLRHRLERARLQANSKADYDQALESAIISSDDILALFAALLRIAQIEGGARRSAFASLDLRQLLAQLADVFGPVAEDTRHQLSLSLNAVPPIHGDRELLTQLFSNLIENAILHTPQGTLVTISLKREGDEIVAAVSDDGPGVPVEEHEKLFRRFYRREASRTRPGYGLGLALAAAVGLAASAPAPADDKDEGWVPLFNGKDFTGWKLSKPESFKIEDGAIVANGRAGHAYYDGSFRNHTFRNFELKVDVMTKPNSNGGIFFHTVLQEKGWPDAGFEVQVNNTYKPDPKKTGSLYNVVNVLEQKAQDDVWFTEHVIVQGPKVTIKVEGKTVVEWTDPEGTAPGKKLHNRVGEGTFALQAHDPKSVVYYKNIRVKRLPD